MDSSKALKHHFKTFRLAGVWPIDSSPYSALYNIWTVFVFLILGFLYPLSQVLNIFFANSVSEMVDCLMITSSVVVVIVKALNFYTTRRGLKEFFKVIKKLDGKIHNEMNSTIKFGCQLYFFYLCLYISACGLLMFQTIFSKPENRMWSSTYAYPFEWAKQTYIYVTGLFAQGIANFLVVIFAVAADTYGVILIHILSSHINKLQKRLKKLGKDENASKGKKFDQLIYCCRIYENILSCEKLLESTLELALFAQFCVSGIVLCTSAYQLTVVPVEDVSKIAFVVMYFICMMFEIFVPCYFGSVALETSQLIGQKIYESNWINQEKKYKQAFLIFLSRTIDPIHLTVYKVLYLDLSTFLNILETAYSLFAVLKNV